MGHTALILGDQLSHANPALEGADRVLIVESKAALSRLRYHRQRRHLVLSAMRHFAQELRDRGLEVDERRNAAGVAEALRDHRDVRAAEPNSIPSRRALAKRGVSFVPSPQFLTDPGDFREWASTRKTLTMEHFYRRQRKRLDVLMDGDQPEGGRWNFDQENRRPPKDGLRAPDPWLPEEDAIDEEVRRDLDGMTDLPPAFGEDGPRIWPATHGEARKALDDFVEHRLAGFGPWQDAMVPGEKWLFHSRLSSSMNLWLIDPLEVVRAVERADAPIQSREGFVRQVIGWREYVWGMYWLRGEQWRADNALDAHTRLPDAFWTGETGMNCLREVVGELRATAYAHHIQRLMILGDLMLLLRIEPWEAVEWFQLAFIDGAEWVMAPNVAGMATYADGGVMMTKPYAAGGNYVNRMSGYCAGCRYQPNQRTGERACPFTVLYWDFIAEHAERFADNRRMRMPLRTLRRFPEPEVAEVRATAAELRRAFAR